MSSSKKTLRPTIRATAPKADDPPLVVGGVRVEPGSTERVEVAVARLPTGNWLSVPVKVVRGRRRGPHLWLSAAIHGDEINGVEIIRRVLRKIRPDELRGAVLAVPVVNVFGFVDQTRYLPDRRDLNRCFPGSPSGSMAARLAHLFMTEVVGNATHGIDYHTGSNHRTNVPQIRANLDDPETLRCATAFGTKLLIDSRLRDGSLREAASRAGIPCLLYEAGEPNRFNTDAITAGVTGTLRLMRELGMIRSAPRPPKTPPVRVSKTTWVRARRGGVLRLLVEIGDVVEKNRPIAMIADTFGEEEVTLRAPVGGMVLGAAMNPLVHRGDAVIHLAVI